MTTVSAHEARRLFAQLLELAFYMDAQIRIQRNKKPIVRLVAEPAHSRIYVRNFGRWSSSHLRNNSLMSHILFFSTLSPRCSCQ